MSSQHGADNHQGHGLWPCHGVELNRCAGNWSKKPAKKGKGGSCYLLPLLQCLPAAAQESLPLSRDAPTMASALGTFPMALCFSAGVPKREKLPSLVEQPWLLQNLGDLPCYAPKETFITMTLNLMRFFYPWADVSGLLLHFSSRDFQWQKLKTFNGNWTLSRKCCLEWSWLAWKIFWMPNSAKLKCFLSAILW